MMNEVVSKPLKGQIQTPGHSLQTRTSKSNTLVYNTAKCRFGIGQENLVPGEDLNLELNDCVVDTITATPHLLLCKDDFMPKFSVWYVIDLRKKDNLSFNIVSKANLVSQMAKFLPIAHPNHDACTSSFLLLSWLNI